MKPKLIELSCFFFTAFILVIILISFSGCASETAYQGYLTAHKSNADGYYLASGKPLLDMVLPSPDPQQPYHLIVNREVKPLVVQQIKDSEWIDPVKVLTVTAGLVAGKYVDYKEKKSDNEAAVDIVRSHDTATTSQVKDYVTGYKNDTYIETTNP